MNNKDIIINFAKELWENKNLNAIDDVFAENAIIHSPINKKQGHVSMKEIANKWLGAFPDILMRWEDFIAEDDKVVSRWRAKGTHVGGLFAVSPAHAEVTYDGITIYTLKDGKVIEYRALVDMYAILTQIGEYQSLSEMLS